MTKVAAVKCPDYESSNLKASISKSLDLIGGLSSFVKPGDRVLLKPNLLSGKDPMACVTTNPRFVAAVARLLQDYGCTPIVGDSPPFKNCTSVAKKSGLSEELAAIGVELIEFNTPVKLKVRDNALFKDIYVAKEVLDADCVINLPKVKTHTQMTLTACVKNMFGAVVGKEKAAWHLKAGIDKDFFAQMLLELYYGLAPDLTIADMIMTMEGDGPGSGTPKHIGAVLAGSDCVAMDTVVCEILGIPIDHVPIIKEAPKVNEDAVIDMSGIELLCDSLSELKANGKGFKLSKKTGTDFGLAPFIKKLLRDTLTSKPVINKKLCTYCKACENICPAQIMSINEGAIKIDYEKCIKCYCCHEICPNSAIKIKQGILLKLIG